MRTLITGTTGFVGRVLCAKMQAAGCQVRGTVRSEEQAESLPLDIDIVLIKSISPDTDWSEALTCVDTVVHLAARVHVMNDMEVNPLAKFRKVNVAGTEHLARKAAAAGIKRFVYLSSVKVNGEATGLRAEARELSFSEDDAPDPQDPYGISKWEAEQVLRQIGSETGLDVVILRPPLVYGPNVKANFLKLIKLTKFGFPLPLGGLQNQRSMIYVGNLVDAIMTSLKHPNAAGETFLVSDGEDISTPHLISMIASAMGKKSRLWPLPPSLLDMLGNIVGKSAEVKRLTGSLRVDTDKIQSMLDWKPPYSMEEGIQETVNWYMNQK